MITVDIIGQLIPNPVSMVVQLCSTLVLFLLVKKFLWKSVMNFFETRTAKMQEDLQASQLAREEAQQDRQKAKDELSSAASKSEQMINAAVKEAKDEKANILAQAAHEADLERKKAHEQIEAERNAMVDQVKVEMVNVAMEAASKLLADKSNSDMDRKAIAEFVKESTEHE